MTPEVHLARVIPVLKARVPGLHAVYLFGSLATGGEHKESDLDIAILTPAALAEQVRWELQADLAELVGRPVDLIDLRQASVVMGAEILRTGELVYEDGTSARAQFEMVTLAEYADLNERRKGIVTDAIARGTIYG